MLLALDVLGHLGHVFTLPVVLLAVAGVPGSDNGVLQLLPGKGLPVLQAATGQNPKLFPNETFVD